MPRFSDEWVVDRTLFDFVNGGSCACCGMANFFPDGVNGMINAISDLETDAADSEIKALQNCPWPPDMREQVWGDRIRLRHKLKKEIPLYREFWKQHGADFSDWCRSLPPSTLKKVLQMPRSEVTDRVHSKYNIHSAFAVVLTAVVEQVAHFDATKYPPDARGTEEIEFEKLVSWDRRGGFTMKVCNAKGELVPDVLQSWLNRMESLGGPKLLDRGVSKSQTDDEDEGGADDAQEREAGKSGPSFRADRRIVRLLIARYWADALIKKYTEDKGTDAFSRTIEEELEDQKD
jgi:hypothetical protein